MSDAKFRRRIAAEAARLIVERVVTEVFSAKRKAAATMGVDFRHQPRRLPSDREVRSEIVSYVHARPYLPKPAPGADRAARDPYVVWALVLERLAGVQQDRRVHPEGDVLYHSLQAFELARDEVPYDEELITAALLHDVGKAIDPVEHVAAGLEALEGTLTPREEYLIAHHMDALAYQRQTLGARSRRRLQQSEWFEDLMILRDIDDRARLVGVQVCTIQQALAFLRDMAEEAA